VIKAEDAIRAARRLIGTPYTDLDCINLIKRVIRDAPGGDKSYTTAGTNTLWDSALASGRYRDLTERHEGLLDVPAGALPFKRYGADDEGHVGIATDEGTVIHASSVHGAVVETELTQEEGWDCWGVHRLIAPRTQAEEPMERYQAVVTLTNPRSYLNMRDAPEASARIIGRLRDGDAVSVQAMAGEGWVYVAGEAGCGYCAAEYLLAVQHEETPAVVRIRSVPVIIDEEGHEFFPQGGWRVELRDDD